MSSHTPLIVITDLDGTLLDHHTYQFTAALPALNALKTRAIPLILSSSKTAAEMKQLRRQIDNTDPFVVENGAGIYVPAGDDYEKVGFGIKREQILPVIHALRANGNANFSGFADFSIDDVMQLTGLDKEQARLACERDFTEPIQWHDTEAKLANFRKLLSEKGMTAVRGGRFISISGKVDKGKALDWLRAYYMKRYPQPPVIIALGDSDNDVPMLEKADYAIVVRSSARAAPKIKHKHVTTTDSTGPKGWNDSLLSLLKDIT